MIVLRGDSMFDGFKNTLEIPKSCVASHTVLSADPLTCLYAEIARIYPNTIMQAKTGQTTPDVYESFQNSENLWSYPTIFWYGRCDKPINGQGVLAALEAMVACLKSEWWICAVPVTANEFRDGRTHLVDQANDTLAAFAGHRFLNPIKALYSEKLLPASRRLDTFHPNDLACGEIAKWLIAHTIKDCADACFLEDVRPSGTRAHPRSSSGVDVESVPMNLR